MDAHVKKGRCICGHDEQDHRRIDVADKVVADFVDLDALPQELRVMRSLCGVTTRRDPWTADRCKCVLYTPTWMLRGQFAAAANGRSS